jgi:hypothetical protein
MKSPWWPGGRGGRCTNRSISAGVGEPLQGQMYFSLIESRLQAVARLQQGTSAAATTLLKMMLDPNTPASVRVRADECVMNQATKAIEIEDIEARVAELERATEASNSERTR